MGIVLEIVAPFFGGPDDRLALDFAVQLCANPRISATVVRIAKCEDAELVQEDSGRSMDKHAAGCLSVPSSSEQLQKVRFPTIDRSFASGVYLAQR